MQHIPNVTIGRTPSAGEPDVAVGMERALSPILTPERLAILVTVLVVAAANLDTAVRWAERWAVDRSPGAGFVPVAVAVYWAIRRRRALAPALGGYGWGVVLVFAGFVLKLASQILMMPFVDRLGCLVQIVGVVGTWFGIRGLAVLWPAFVLLFAAIPAPTIVQSRLLPVMGEAAAGFGVVVVELLGGTVLHNGGTIELMTGASGARSVEAMVMPWYFVAMGLSAAVCMKGGWIRRAIVLSMGGVLLFAANATRVATLALVSELGDQANGVVAWAMVVATGALLWVISRSFQTRERAT